MEPSCLKMPLSYSVGSAPSSSGSPRVTMETDHASMSVQLAPFSPGSSGQQHKQTGTPPVPPSPSLSSAQHWSTPVESSTSGVPHSPAPHFTSSAIATESSMFSSVGIMSWLPPATASSMLSMATSNEVSSSAALLPPQSSTTGQGNDTLSYLTAHILSLSLVPVPAYLAVSGVTDSIYACPQVSWHWLLE